MLIDGKYIKYISLNTNTWAFQRHTGQQFDYNNFNHFVELVTLGNKPTCTGYYIPRKNTLLNSKAMYLGSIDDIEQIIKNKLYIGNIDDLQKVYFDKSSNFSRQKLSINTTIKKTINIDNSDAIIIPDKLNVDNYIPDRKYGSKLNSIIILYSKETNNYFIIDYYPVSINEMMMHNSLLKLINQYSDPYLEKEQQWVSALINSNILPNDCEQIYDGPIILLDTTQHTFINNLINNYNNIITDSQLNSYVLKKLDNLNSENIQSINSMLSSKDANDVKIGLKILNNYNILENAGAIMLLLTSNKSNIYDTKASITKSFKDILSSLQLEPHQFYNYSTNFLLSHAYKISSSKEDRISLKNMAKELMNHRIKNYVNGIIGAEFRNFDFNVNFTIE